MSDLSLLSNILGSWQGYSITLAVLFASIVGSTHCIAMCGPVVVLLKKNNGNIHLYNIGRLITYLLLGFLAGLLGEVFLNSHYGVLSLVSTILISAVLIYLGLNLIKNNTSGLHLPSFYSLILSRPLGWIFRLNIYIRSLLLGIINGFAPCGWLYVFVLASIALKNSFYGALLMFFFWLGTVPSLTFLSYLSKKVFDYLPGNIVKVAGFILIFVGVFNLMINFIPTDGQSIHSHKGHALSVHEEMVREGENE